MGVIILNNYTNLNALKGIANECIKKLPKSKAAQKKLKPDAIQALWIKQREQARLLGFSYTRLKYEIALINGVLDEQ